MGAKTTIQIAEWVCKTNYDSFGLSSSEMSYVKGLALSYVGQALAGSTMPFGKLVTKHIKDYGCPAEAGVIGAGFRTLTEYAALANGATSHTTELEDNSFPESIYTCGAWPTAFALGEKLKLSGRAVLEAFVIGWEVAARLAIVAVEAYYKGWATFAIFLSVGNAAMAAKLLKLNVEQTASAMSLAASQAAGMGRQTGTGAHLIEAGFAGRNGILAAMLAKRGYTGNPTIFEGHAGLMDLLAGQPDFDLPLGDGWRVLEIGIKKYPCCWFNHLGIDTVLDLIAEHNIAWDNVESVEHAVNKTLPMYLKYPQPKTGEDARFSLEHCTVCCFFEKQVFLDSFTDEKARDPRFVEARRKVKLTVHPEYPAGCIDWHGPVTIRLKDGTVWKKVRTSIKGDATDKLTPNEVMKKYMDCLDYAGILSREWAEKVAEMTLALDKVKDVSKLTSILTFPEKSKNKVKPNKKGTK
jgi:2-methylcitrate dehydratase PrpD